MVNIMIVSMLLCINCLLFLALCIPRFIAVFKRCLNKFTKKKNTNTATVSSVACVPQQRIEVHELVVC